MSIKVRFSILFSWYVDDLCRSIIGHRSINNKYRYRYHLWQHGNAWTNDIFPTGWLLPDSYSWVVCLDNPERRKTRQQLSTKKNMGNLGLVMNRGFTYTGKIDAAEQHNKSKVTARPKSKSCKREEGKKHGPSKKYGAYAVRYKRHSAITHENSTEYPGMSYQWPLYDMSRWRMIRTRHLEKCVLFV